MNVSFRVTKSTVRESGGCNACRAIGGVLPDDRIYTIVLEASNIVIRLCAPCLKRLGKYAETE
jgi:hypothetical protein